MTDGRFKTVGTQYDIELPSHEIQPCTGTSDNSSDGRKSVAFSSKVDVVGSIDESVSSPCSSALLPACSSNTPSGPPRVLASDFASGHHELTSIDSIDVTGQRRTSSETFDEGKVDADAGTACVSGSSRHTAAVTQRGSSIDPTQAFGPANCNNIRQKTDRAPD